MSISCRHCFGGLWDPFNVLLTYPTSISSDLRTPSLNVNEQDGIVTYQLEMPGVNKENIVINEENGSVTITGEKKSTQNRSNDAANYYYVESSYGRYQRTFTLPKHAKRDTLVASFNNGVLNVSVETNPQSTQTGKRSIPVD